MIITHNKARHRFETEIEGELAILDYIFHNGVLDLIHTYVPPENRHQGIAFALVKYALDYAKTEHLKVNDGCPTVTLFIEQHPEYEFLLANN